MTKYLYLFLALGTITFSALSLAYVADKYYQLGYMDRGNGLATEYLKLPVGVCLAKDGQC